MKKILGTLMVLLAAVTFSSITLAAQATGGEKPSQETSIQSDEKCVVNVIGPIVSIDKAKNRITVKDQSDKQNKVIIVDPKEISKLKVGDVVKFALTASPLAQDVEVMKLEKSKKGK
jgi:hypothetical protein